MAEWESVEVLILSEARGWRQWNGIFRPVFCGSSDEVKILFYGVLRFLGLFFRLNQIVVNAKRCYFIGIYQPIQGLDIVTAILWKYQ